MSNRISIAMATYNGAAYLRAQLHSFVEQTRLPDELVVCDDASADDTLAILEDFRASAPFEVRIEVNAENLGPVRNFEKAISLCRGEIIFLSDQDDVWSSDKLAFVEAAFAEDATTQVVLNDQLIADADLNSTGRTKLQNITALGISSDAMVTGCCTAFTRGFRDAILPFPEDIPSHDAWIGRLATVLGARRIIHTPLQLYRRHGGNVSDSVMSRGEGTSALDVARRFAGRSAGEVWGAEAKMLEQCVARAEEHRADIGLWNAGSPARVQAARDKIDLLRRRARIVSLPRHRRFGQVVGFLQTGKYHAFSGWRSALADLTR